MQKGLCQTGSLKGVVHQVTKMYMISNLKMQNIYFRSYILKYIKIPFMEVNDLSTDTIIEIVNFYWWIEYVKNSLLLFKTVFFLFLELEDFTDRMLVFFDLILLNAGSYLWAMEISQSEFKLMSRYKKYTNIKDKRRHSKNHKPFSYNIMLVCMTQRVKMTLQNFYEKLL